MLGKHNQNKAALKRCKVSDADYVLNICFYDEYLFLYVSF